MKDKNTKTWWQNTKLEKLWYLIGLITSDGSLSKDGRHIDLTSKEYQFLNLIKQSYQIPNKIGYKTNGRNKSAYRIQISSKSFYDFLTTKGLTPNKSKILCKIGVPNKFFIHFLRGVFDGDGCIRKWKSADQRIEQFYCKITSGSKEFLLWVKKTLKEQIDIEGTIHPEKYKVGNGFILKISSKNSVKKFLEICYKNNYLALNRKRNMALQYLQCIN